MWRNLPDGHDDKIACRTRTGEFKYDGDTRQMTWQFRNGYSTRAKFQYTICYYTDKGRRQCNNYDEALGPGATSNTSGTWSIGDGNRGLEIAIKSLVLETPSVIEFPGRKKP